MLNENLEFYDENGMIEEKAKIYNQGFSNHQQMHSKVSLIKGSMVLSNWVLAL